MSELERPKTTVLKFLLLKVKEKILSEQWEAKFGICLKCNNFLSINKFAECYEKHQGDNAECVGCSFEGICEGYDQLVEETREKARQLVFLFKALFKGFNWI